MVENCGNTGGLVCRFRLARSGDAGAEGGEGPGIFADGNPVAVDFDGYGALKHGDGDDEAAAAFELLNLAFETGEGTVVEADAQTLAEKGPGLGGEAGTDDGADGGDFLFRDFGGSGAEAYDGHHAGGG